MGNGEWGVRDVFKFGEIKYVCLCVGALVSTYPWPHDERWLAATGIIRVLCTRIPLQCLALVFIRELGRKAFAEYIFQS